MSTNGTPSIHCCFTIVMMQMCQLGSLGVGKGGAEDDGLLLEAAPCAGSGVDPTGAVVARA